MKGNPYLPVFLDIRGTLSRGKKCLVVGGGAIALKKVQSLITGGGRVTVVAKTLLASILKIKDITISQRSFRPADIKGCHLVIAATDDQTLNARVSRLCHAQRILVNVVDQPALCNFIFPAVVKRGPVTFAVSTGGASPALAKFLKGRLGKYFGPECGSLASCLGRLRPALLQVPMAQRKKILQKILKEFPWKN
jgi:siroheme synthase-like protein